MKVQGADMRVNFDEERQLDRPFEYRVAHILYGLECIRDCSVFGFTADSGLRFTILGVQRHLAHKKQPPPGTLQQAYA